jgi:agmatinase
MLRRKMSFLETQTKYGDARFVVVPVPYEATTTYGKGTKNGPAAILRASEKLESFDEDLGYDPNKKAGIHTLKPVSLSSLVPRPPRARSVSDESRGLSSIISDGKIPVVLGGEHSITPYALRSFAKHYKNLSVLQFDAHADLRDKYKGSKNNHACVMRRVLEICSAVQVGIRSISEEGWNFANETGQINKIHWAEKLELAEKIENQLYKNVYITIDVDVFDPSVVPATGTPEPGGMFWYEVLDILTRVCRDKNIVGFDVVELAPRKGDIASDFTVAKLIYKIMGYISA